MWLLAAAGLVVASAALGLATPLMVGGLWDALSSASGMELLLPAVKLGAVLVAKFLVQWLADGALTTSSERVAARLRNALFAALLHQDMAHFDAGSTAGFVSTLTEDVKEVRDALRALIGEGLSATTSIVVGVASLLSVSPTLTAGLGMALPAIIGVGTAWAGQLRALSRQHQELQAATAAAAAESLSNIRTVRAFTGETAEAAKFASLAAASSESSASLGSAIGLFRSTAALALSAVAGGVLWWGGTMVQVRVAGAWHCHNPAFTPPPKPPTIAV